MPGKKAFIRRVDGLTFVGKTDSGHWIVTDTSEEAGGHDAGIRPKELLLIAIGGCTGGDVESILKKKQVNVDRFEMNITANEASDHPKIFTSIHIEYVLYGNDIHPEDVERAIELSQTKYCAVSAMLGKAATITHSYRIELLK